MANFFFIGGVNSNTNQIGNWSATSGGGSNGATPTISDDIIFDSNSNVRSCTQNLPLSCLSITFKTGYTQTFTQTSTLTIAAGGATCQSGAYVITGAGIWIFNASTTITTNGRTLRGITLNGPITITMADTLNCGALLFAATGNITFSGAFDINCTTFTCTAGILTHTFIQNINASGLVRASGSAGSAMTLNGGTINCAAGFSFIANDPIIGTTNFNVTGGTYTGGGTIAVMSNNLTLSNVTISNTQTFFYKSGTLTANIGIVATGTQFTINGTCTLDTNGTTWNNVTILGAPTLTLNSLFSASGTVTLSTNTTFAGTAGFSFSILTDTIIGLTHIFQATKTYTVTSSLTLIGTRASPKTIKSSSAGSQAILNFTGSILEVTNVNATDINSSGGTTIWNFGSTNILSNTLNWSAFTYPGTRANVFMT